MSFQKALVTSLGILTVCGASACAAKSGPSDGTGGGGGGSNATCDTIDFASYATAAPVSFSKDVMPIFGQSCTTSDCHNSKDKNAKLDLGTRCKYDLTTKICTYPADAAAAAALDPMMTQTVPWAPLTPDVIAATYASLLSPALTVLSPTVQRIAPGDPEHSFLIQKISGKQQQPGYSCKSQDTTHAVSQNPCGDNMPLDGTLLCQGTSRPKFDILAAWIAQGAHNDSM